MTWKSALGLVAYFLFFLVCAYAMIWWQRRQRKMRKPFGDDLRLLRGPGETQLTLSRQMEENSLYWLLVAASVPVGLFCVMLGFTRSLPEVIQLGWVAVSVVAFISTYIAAARWFAAKSREGFDRYLGYFGERIVAEHLDPLKARGWRIFHDVPGLNNGTKFNLDHVGVGPTGVFVVETKTRRKGAARPGFEDHKAYFDGRRLVWPWGEDNHGLEQAERNALWLADTLKTEIGEPVYVTPFLALPGWWVENKPSRDSRICRVVNPKALPTLLAKGATVLSTDQINAIAAKLEFRCRDVTY